VILSFPLLSLDKSPRWLGAGILNDGILTGGLHLSGKLRNPKVDCDLQFLDHPVHGSSELSQQL
jgi:hypothetical protein